MRRKHPTSLLLALLAALALASPAGCSGRYAAPRNIGGAAAFLMVGGSAAWAVGEHRGQDSLVNAGFAAAAVGLAAAIVSGGWMAVSAGCTSDADCDETEACREVPAPPGGVPYKQCSPR